MDIRKQESHSVFSKVFQVKDENYLALTVMSAFPFDRSSELLDETELWHAAGSGVSNHGVLDMFMPKQKGEVLAAGKFFSPGGRAAAAGRVRISVGSVDKTLHVFGDRHWIKKAGLVTSISDPQPMTEMDITYMNAFGGTGYRQNPLGKGMEEEGSEGTIPLPHIEYPDQLIGSPSDRPEPAGFGPIGPEWQQRAGKLGTYDRKWLETRWPWFPEDMDWTYFNTAPEDQQIAGYFIGDEQVVIENMHPEQPTIHASLPGLRMRCFIWQGKDGDGIFEELGTRLDTVWLFPAHQMGVVVWRATVPIRDDEAKDITAAFVAHEHLTEDRRPMEYYRDMFFTEVEGEEGVEGPEAVPSPPAEEAASITEPVRVRATEAARDPETDALIKELENRIADSEAQVMAELKRLGLDPEQLMKELPLAAGLGMVESSGPPAEMSVQELERQLARGEAELNEMIKKFGFDPDKPMELSKKVDQAEPPSMKDFVKKMQESGISDPEMEKHLLELGEENEQARREVAALLEEQEKEQVELGKEESVEEETQEELKPEADAEYTRERVLEGYSEGWSFVGKDLSSLDLSGLDLSQIDLREAVLEKVNFSGTIMSEARLSGAVLVAADLSKAKFTQTDLSGAQLSEVKGEQADFSGSDLSGADLTRGHFAGVDFTEATMEEANCQGAILRDAVFEKASAKGAVFVAADLVHARFVEADVTGADFSDAALDHADFSRAVAGSATFDGAGGEHVQFGRADLRGSRADKGTSFLRADFELADLAEAYWEGAKLVSARFRHANLRMADLSGCDLKGADFYRAFAPQAKFTKADLSDADMTSINLFRGDMSKAQLVGTDLKGANLFEVEFLKAKLGKVNFQHANLKRTKLARWVPK